MTREEILATTAQNDDLRPLHDILTRDTPGAGRVWKAIEEQQAGNPADLTRYLLGNKDFLLRYSNDEVSRIRTAKTCILMHAAGLEGHTEKTEARLSKIVDDKYSIYGFEWDNALGKSLDEAEKELSVLPYEEKAALINDVLSVTDQKAFIERLCKSFGIEDETERDYQFDEQQEEDIAPAVSPKRYERYYKAAEKASIYNWGAVVERSVVCGCFCCCRIYDSLEVTDMFPARGENTAMCPYCGIDSVIGDYSGIPIRKDVLKELSQLGFGEGMEEVGTSRCLGSGSIHHESVIARRYPDGPARRDRFVDTLVREDVGGTCANVMCILARYGVEAYPQACLDESPEGLLIKTELERYGCDTRFVTNSPDGRTALVQVTRGMSYTGALDVISQTVFKDGNQDPGGRFLSEEDQAPQLVLDITSECPPDFYFFDVPAAGHLYVASYLKRVSGTVVFYELTGELTTDARCAVAASDIVKFSGDRIPDTAFTEAFTDKLFIQTFGADRIRFKLRNGSWRTVRPESDYPARNWDGAGDWMSAAFILGLVNSGRSFDDLHEKDCEMILRKAWRYAFTGHNLELGTKGRIRPGDQEPE